MLGRPISLAACCALGASAFLLPPSTASEADSTPWSLDVVSDLKSQILQLPCSSCAWSSKPEMTEMNEDDDMVWIQGGANNLVLNFTVAEDGQSLLVNDHYIYPFEKLIQDKNVMEDMYVDQVSASVSDEQIYNKDYTGAKLQVTGSGLTENEVVNDETDEEATYISLTWQLLSLEHQTMTVAPVSINLLRDDTGTLHILWVEPAPMRDAISVDDLPLEITLPEYNEAPANADELFARPPKFLEPETKPHQRPCKLPGPFCAISDFMDSAFGSFHRKPCPGRKFGGAHLPTHIRPHFGELDSPDYSEDNEPEHQHFGPPHLNKVDFKKPWHPLGDSKPFDHPPHHGGHRHGHHRHGFFHAISRGILAVLIPIMAGITVGIIVSVTGLLFGRFLGWMWFTVLRRGRRGYKSVALDEEVCVLETEPKVIVVEEEAEEALPVYEHAPPYESRENTTA